MRIGGLQKLTLLDFPGHMACTVFTAGCNFRCPFCHNSALVLPEQFGPGLETEEFLSFLRKRQGVLEGVAITGGEPLLHGDLPELLGEIRKLGYLIKLDTNGSFPERLEGVIDAGLADYVAMDVKNSPALYAATVGLESLDLGAIERSRDLLLQGRVDYEFRTTVVKGLHTAESLRETASWIGGAKAWYLQQYRDSGRILHAEGLGSFTEEEMKTLAAAAAEIFPAVALRGV